MWLCESRTSVFICKLEVVDEGVYGSLFWAGAVSQNPGTGLHALTKGRWKENSSRYSSKLVVAGYCPGPCSVAVTEHLSLDIYKGMRFFWLMGLEAGKSKGMASDRLLVSPCATSTHGGKQRGQRAGWRREAAGLLDTAHSSTWLHPGLLPSHEAPPPVLPPWLVSA